MTEKCTLKCVDCSNLMQYYQNYQNADDDVLKESIKQLFGGINYIKEVRLIGGEPLIYKNIDQIISLIQNYTNYDKIVILQMEP